MEIPVQIHGKPYTSTILTDLRREFSARSGEIYNIRIHTTPVRVQCLEGLFWVTQEKDPQDYVLQRGQAAFFGGDGQIVIQSLSKGKFRVISA